MKKLFFGLFAIAIAISGSAFTSAQRAPGDIYGNFSGSSYSLIPSGTFNDSFCQNSAAIPCSYTETPAGAGHVTAPFTASQASTWVGLGYLTSTTENNGVYLPE